MEKPLKLQGKKKPPQSRDSSQRLILYSFRRFDSEMSEQEALPFHSFSAPDTLRFQSLRFGNDKASFAIPLTLSA